MKALVKTGVGPNAMALLDVPPPTPGAGQVLMAVREAALCGTDTHIADGRMKIRPPLIIGHELSGTVAAVGEGVAADLIGRRVTTETDAVFCGRCTYCLAGDQHLCASRTGIGTTAPGGAAEFVALPASGIHVLPDSVDLVTGALTEPLAVAVRAVIERGAVAAGEHAVVIGPCTIGLLVAQVARSVGAEVSVAGLERHGARFALARELGVDRTLNLDEAIDPGAVGGRDGLGIDVVFECAGDARSVAIGLDILRKGGRMIMVAFTPGLTIPVDLDRVVQRELAIVASRGKRPSCFAIALELLDQGRVRAAPLVTHRFPLEAWQDALATTRQAGTKVLIDIGSQAP